MRFASPIARIQILAGGIGVECRGRLPLRFTGNHRCRRESTVPRRGARDQVVAQSQSCDTVTITCRGKTVLCRKGALLRTALLEAGVSPHNGESKLINCRGLGTCGTCAVRVVGAVAPEEKSSKEKLRLNFPPHSFPANQYLRLACQVTVEGDLEVTKMAGFWGSDVEALSDEEASAFRLPLGNLEYILDRKRK